MVRHRLFAAAVLAIPVLTAAQASAQEPVLTLDLRSLYHAAPSDADQRREVYDTLVAAACLQGIVNRDDPNLYLFHVLSVVDGSIDTDQLWFDRMQDPTVGAGILDGRPIETLANLDDALQVYSLRIQGLVVWDEKVPATVNAAFAAAGAEDLIAVRWDANPQSLYQRLRTIFPVKVWLVNQNGSSRFLDNQGGASIPDITRQTSQSAKADAYVWVLEKYAKAGLLSPTDFGWMLDARWINDPTDYSGATTAAHQWQVSNRDFLVARRGVPFDLSPWSDVTPTDDPGQPLGTDPAVLTELMADARSRAGDEVITIRGFFGWQFKYTTLQGLPPGHEPVQGEWTGVRLVSPYAAGLDADAPGVATMANASFYSHVPLDEVPSPQRRPTPEDLVGGGLLSGLASNGGFEDGEDGWVMHATNHVVYTETPAGPTRSHSGLRFLECNTSAVGDDQQDNLYRDGPPVDAGQRVTLRAFVRAPGAPVQGELVIWATGGTQENATTQFTAGSDWSEVRVEFDVQESGHTATRGQLYLRTAGANLDVDDVAFYAGDAADGLVEPANYMLWFVGDYDAAAWIYAFTPMTWDGAGRGIVPLAWDFSGHVATRFPLFFRHALATRTARDFFIGADSGPGYGNPGVMDATARGIWARAGVRAARRLDTSQAWILNPLDPFQAEHMDAVAPFCGDGVLLMSQGGLTTPSLAGQVPVVALDNAGGDDVSGLESWIVGATQAQPASPQFRAMRVVLKPSTDLAAVSTDLVQSNPGRKLRFVDPFAFFALARRQMGGSNNHRASFSEVAAPPVATSGTGTISLTVRNDGWETWRATGPNAYRVGVHVAPSPPLVGSLPQDPAGYPVRIDLPTDVAPGELVTATADLPAQPQAGKYTVQLDMVEEGVTWFETQGDIPAQLTLLVLDPLPDGGLPLDGGLPPDGSVVTDGSSGDGSGGDAGADGTPDATTLDASVADGSAGAGGSGGTGSGGTPAGASTDAGDGGCGCRMSGSRGGAGMGWLIVLGALVARRRQAAKVISAATLGLLGLGCSRGAPPPSPEARQPVQVSVTEPPAAGEESVEAPTGGATRCDGDTISAKSVGIWFGKPPLKHHLLDMHLSNPLDEPVWILLPERIDEPKFGDIGGIGVVRLSDTPPAYLWELGGMDGFRAVRLPAGASVTLRELTFRAWWSDIPESATFPVRIARTLRIEGTPIEVWVGGEGWTAKTGVFDAKIDRMKTEIPWHRDHPKGDAGFPLAAPIDIDVICSVDVEVGL